MINIASKTFTDSNHRPVVHYLLGLGYIGLDIPISQKRWKYTGSMTETWQMIKWQCIFLKIYYNISYQLDRCDRPKCPWLDCPASNDITWVISVTRYTCMVFLLSLDYMGTWHTWGILTAGLCSQTHNPPKLLTECILHLGLRDKARAWSNQYLKHSIRIRRNIMLHAIQNLELSLNNPSLGVDVIVLIRQYPDVFSNTSFARRTGQYTKVSQR